MLRSLFVASALVVAVDAHTNMAVPQVQFPDGFYNGNSPYARINGDKFSSASSIPSYEGVQKIAKVMESYKTLREMMMANVNLSTISGHTGTKECGLTLTTGAKQPLPDAIDFPWGHPGPCEAWCDNTRLFYNANCQGNNVGKIPVDKTKCQGASILQAMYVGVHVSNWEAYANCAPLQGGTKTDAATLFDDHASGSGASGGASANNNSGSSDSAGNDADGGSSNATPALTPGKPSNSSSGSGSTTPTPTPTPTPAPASNSGSGSTTPTPSSNNGSGSTTPTPTNNSGSGSTTPTTDAPATTAPAPKSKCKRRHD